MPPQRHFQDPDRVRNLSLLNDLSAVMTASDRPSAARSSGMLHHAKSREGSRSRQAFTPAR
jgi:hypothetical protein